MDLEISIERLTFRLEIFVFVQKNRLMRKQYYKKNSLKLMTCCDIEQRLNIHGMIVLKLEQ
jgi:hypothetical protein